MIYIDNGNSVEMFDTSKNVEKAIITLLKRDEDLNSALTDDGWEVKIVEKERIQ